MFQKHNFPSDVVLLKNKYRQHDINPHIYKHITTHMYECMCILKYFDLVFQKKIFHHLYRSLHLVFGPQSTCSNPQPCSCYHSNTGWTSSLPPFLCLQTPSTFSFSYLDPSVLSTPSRAQGLIRTRLPFTLRLKWVLSFLSKHSCCLH